MDGTDCLALGDPIVLNCPLRLREPLFSSRECQGSQSVNPIYQGAEYIIGM